MEHGMRFIEEHPNIGSLLEQLYVKRELDDWYREKCKENFILPDGLIYNFKNLKIDVMNNYSPLAQVVINLPIIKGHGEFELKCQIQLRISKIVAAYDINYLYDIRHRSIKQEIGAWGPPQTDELKEIGEVVNNVMSGAGYIQLSELYDLHDTVYEWIYLKNIDCVNRRLTLEDAIFMDILELCNTKG